MKYIINEKEVYESYEYWGGEMQNIIRLKKDPKICAYVDTQNNFWVFEKEGYKCEALNVNGYWKKEEKKNEEKNY